MVKLMLVVVNMKCRFFSAFCVAFYQKQIAFDFVQYKEEEAIKSFCV
jgi:hypothetical protein